MANPKSDSILQQRANAREELRAKRDSAPEDYVKEQMSGGPGMGNQRLMGTPAVPKAQSSNTDTKNVERKGSELKRQMEDMVKSMANKDQQAAGASDRASKITHITQNQTTDSIKMLSSVFQEQSGKIIAAVRKASKDQVEAIRSMNSGGGANSFNLLDYFKNKGKTGAAGTGAPGGPPAPPGGPGAAGPSRLSRGLKALGSIGSKIAAPLVQGGSSLLSSASGLVQGGVSRLPAAAQNALGSIRSMGSSALGAGSRFISGAGEAGTSALTGLKNGASAIGDFGSKILGKVGLGGAAAEAGPGATAGSGIASKALGSIARVAGPLAAAYEVGTVLTDDTKDSGQKSQGVANVAGGFAGATAGAAAGAAMGSVLAPVTMGASVPIGAVMGGIAGYFGGEKFTNAVGTSLSEAVSGSKVGETLGQGMALVMSPFSADASEALKLDYKNNILPKLTESFEPLTKSTTELKDKLSDYTSAIVSAAGQIWAGIKKSAGDLVQGGANAVDKVKAGASGAYDTVKSAYAKDGVTGAVKSLGSASSTVLGGIKSGAGDLASGAAKAGVTVSEAVKLAGSTLGAVSEKYESGGRGVGTVSSGKGDAGGVSYGKYQLATNNGSMNKFLNSPEGASTKAQMGDLKPGTPEFNSKYKQLTSGEGAKDLEKSQQQYMTRTHFEPQAAKLQKDLGLDVSKESKGFQEAVYSTATQYGPNSSVISNAFKGKDMSKMSDSEKINAIQDYKAANIGTNFKSSAPEVQSSIAKRVESERATLLAVNQASTKAKSPGAGSEIDAKKTPMGITTPDATKVAQGSTSPVLAQATNNNVSPSAPPALPVAKASAVPQPIINPNVPAEVQSVAVTNQSSPQMPQSSGSNNMAQAGGSASQPTLDEMPMVINDMGLVLLQIGHV